MDNSTNAWLSLDETAAYLNMGKTALYAMAQEGKIPAKKIGKKWTFEKKSSMLGLGQMSLLKPFS